MNQFQMDKVVGTMKHMVVDFTWQTMTGYVHIIVKPLYAIHGYE